MIQNHEEFQRVMALSMATGRVGYVVLEGPHSLIDWGGIDLRGLPDKDRIDKIVAKIAWNLPDVLIFEDTKAKGCMKGEQSRMLTKRIKAQAGLRAINTETISRLDVRKFFAPFGGKNKDVIARIVANQLPRLMQELPKKREPWDNEQYRMTLFEAASFALVWFKR